MSEKLAGSGSFSFRNYPVRAILKSEKIPEDKGMAHKNCRRQNSSGSAAVFVEIML
jgi:hypothetical protein